MLFLNHSLSRHLAIDAKSIYGYFLAGDMLQSVWTAVDLLTQK